ncbi:MAG: TonB-dependent receptor plug domain-containing protein, partial [Muribaculaceae bacterium]|nr:TonB-dependent receptor plug domain-containing protein [Muribaculaceae bacterium]
MNTIIKHFSVSVRFIAAALLLACSFSLRAAGEHEIKGRVVDPDGKPIPGAVVNVAEQSKIVLTDADGAFTLVGAMPEDEGNASRTGYKTAVVPVESLNEFLVITLDPDNDPYSHEMALAFTEKPKKTVIEGTSTVSGTELQRYPITVLQNAFNSTLTGVQTYEASSEPGWAETKLYIRGLRTLNSSARNPIFIVDNVERDISFLDAFPIESVTILKDAAATAIYGMRGANGVVLVTTKRGQAGKTNIEFTQEFGWQQLTNTVENQNSYNTALT